MFFYQICLNINDTNEYDYADSDVYDLPEQNLIREDALRLVRKYKIINIKLCTSIFQVHQKSIKMCRHQK